MYSDDVHDRLAYEGDEENVLKPGVQEFFLNRCLELQEEIATEADSAEQELKEQALTGFCKIVQRDVKSKLMIALLEGRNLKEAAKLAGISSTTAWRIRKQDEFRAAFAERSKHGDPLRAELIGLTDKELIRLIEERKKEIAA